MRKNNTQQRSVLYSLLAVNICQVRGGRSNTCIHITNSSITAAGMRADPNSALWKEDIRPGLFRIKTMFSKLHICINKNEKFIARKLLGNSSKCIFLQVKVTKPGHNLFTRIINVYSRKPLNFNVKGLQKNRDRKHYDHKSLRFIIRSMTLNQIKLVTLKYKGHA